MDVSFVKKKYCFKELTSELNVSIVLKCYILTQDQWGCEMCSFSSMILVQYFQSFQSSLSLVTKPG